MQVLRWGYCLWKAKVMQTKLLPWQGLLEAALIKFVLIQENTDLTVLEVFGSRLNQSACEREMLLEDENIFQDFMSKNT